MSVDRGALSSIVDKHGIKFTPMTIANSRGGGLKNYNVLILPEGSAGRYMSAFGSGGVAALKEFANSGGTIVTRYEDLGPSLRRLRSRSP